MFMCVKKTQKKKSMKNSEIYDYLRFISIFNKLRLNNCVSFAFKCDLRQYISPFKDDTSQTDY